MTAASTVPADPVENAVLHLLDRIEAQERQIAALGAEITKLQLRADAHERQARANRKAGK